LILGYFIKHKDNFDCDCCYIPKEIHAKDMDTNVEKKRTHLKNYLEKNIIKTIKADFELLNNIKNQKPEKYNQNTHTTNKQKSGVFYYLKDFPKIRNLSNRETFLDKKEYNLKGDKSKKILSYGDVFDIWFPILIKSKCKNDSSTDSTDFDYRKYYMSWNSWSSLYPDTNNENNKEIKNFLTALLFLNLNFPGSSLKDNEVNILPSGFIYSFNLNYIIYNKGVNTWFFPGYTEFNKKNLTYAEVDYICNELSEIEGFTNIKDPLNPWNFEYTIKKVKGKEDEIEIAEKTAQESLYPYLNKDAYELLSANNLYYSNTLNFIKYKNLLYSFKRFEKEKNLTVLSPYINTRKGGN